MEKLGKFANFTPARGWVALVCLLLIAMSTAVQTVHLHPTDLVNANDAKHCPACQIAHSPVQITMLPTIAVANHAIAFLPAASDANPNSALDSFALFSRPPPLV